jgi:hypothetical protein
MFVGSEVVLDVSFGVACARLAALAHGGWLKSASSAAYHEWSAGLARVRPAESMPLVSRLVEVHFRDLVMHGDSAVLALRWEAAGPGGMLFPVLDADISLAPVADSKTTLELAGSYRPPLGKVGAVLDRMALHRVATATVRDFVARAGESLVHPASAVVWEAERAESEALGLSWLPPAPGTT